MVQILATASQVTRAGGCNNEVAALLSDHYTEVPPYADCLSNTWIDQEPQLPRQ